MVAPNLNQGLFLLDDLRKAGIDVELAAWVLDDTQAYWRLVIVSKKLAGLGPLRAYDELRSIMQSAQHQTLDLDTIRVAPQHDRLATLLAGMARTKAIRAGDVLGPVALADFSLEGLYIYPLEQSAPA